MRLAAEPVRDPSGHARVTRREVLGLAALAGTAALGGCDASRAGHGTGTTAAIARTTTTLAVGSRPEPKAPPGTDLIPQFDHLVVCMLENHSFDNMIGTSGRGDGLTIGPGGTPTNTNPYGPGRLLRSFHMPTECQLNGHPSQDWNASHAQYDDGKCDGFAESGSGPVSMGYYTDSDMPFTFGLARTFPISDRYFCSVLAQTLPNRRYLLAGTSLGLIDDSLLPALPPAGTILDSFNRHGVSWRNYYSNLPSVYSWFGLLREKAITEHVVPIESFFEDCSRGELPSFSLVDPNFSISSEENPQNVQEGDGFLASVVKAVTTSPNWDRSLLVWTYDEHGGYYDHVPPLSAPEPDDVPPDLKPGDTPGSFDRFGFRVPMGVVSPYAKRDYVSHTVCDHTSVLKLCERKWNLPSLTRRDSAAADFLDMVDFAGAPGFRVAPRLPAPANPALSGCQPGQAGVIPPPSAVETD